MDGGALQRDWSQGAVEADRADEQLVVNLHCVAGVVEAEDNEAVGLQMTDENSTVGGEFLSR